MCDNCKKQMKQYLALSREFNKLVWSAPRGDHATEVWAEELKEIKAKIKQMEIEIGL